MAEQRHWEVAANSRDIVGEGPVWVAAENAIYWVDILGAAINRMELDGGAVTRWAVPEPIGFIVPRRDHKGFIAGMRSGLFFLETNPLRLEPIGNPDLGRPGNRFNDGKAGPDGYLWACTTHFEGPPSKGGLYRVDGELQWQIVDNDYAVGNGPAVAPDGRTMYFADSPQRTIFRLHVDAGGRRLEKTPFIIIEEEASGVPDGMTLDSEGFLWVAHWDGGRLTRYNPDGDPDMTVELPASRITSMTFAGHDCNLLFATSARLDRDGEPFAGALFKINVDIRGRDTCTFAG